MSRRVLMATAAGMVAGGILFNAPVARADMPTVDFTMVAAVQAMQNALSNAFTRLQDAATDALTGLTNPNSVASLLTKGFTQMANYAKAQVGAHQQTTDASNAAMARFHRDLRNAGMRDQHTPNVQNCTALDNGQAVAAAAQQGWRTGRTIAAVMDPRAEGLPGTPAYEGTGQAMAAANQVHASRYCSPTEASAGLCTAAAPAMQNADQRAATLFAENYGDQTGVNAANDFGTNLIQPIVPAALRGDQLKSINGQDAAARRREYNARISLARTAINLAIGQQSPGVTLTPQQQALLTSQGLPVPASGSWMQALTLEVNRRISDTGWSAGLQAMPPASVQREVATELALNNYIGLQNLRWQMLHATIAAAQLSSAEQTRYRPVTQMPNPVMAGGG